MSITAYVLQCYNMSLEVKINVSLGTKNISVLKYDSFTYLKFTDLKLMKFINFGLL